MSTTSDISMSGAERRQTQRVTISFRIEVCGREPKGSVFQDETTTIDVNENGCKFDLVHEITRGDLITIRNITDDEGQPEGGKRVLFQVVWVETRQTRWTVGAKKLQDKDLWPLKFPRRSWPEYPAKALS
jgi:hypothetical protein